MEGTAGVGRAQDDPTKSALDMLRPGTEQVISQGLDYLVAHQNEDGSFGAEGYRRNVAVVSLTGLALMANGSTAGAGALRKADQPMCRLPAESRPG